MTEGNPNHYRIPPDSRCVTIKGVNEEGDERRNQEDQQENMSFRREIVGVRRSNIKESVDVSEGSIADSRLWTTKY